MNERISPEEREEFQNELTELREAQRTIERLEAQSEALSNSIEEIKSTMETLEGLEDAETGSEILVPIGSGSFVPAEIKKPNKILSNLGSDLVAERSPKEVTKLLKKRKKDYENSKEQAQEKIEELSDRIEELRPKLQSYMARAQAESEEMSSE